MKREYLNYYSQILQKDMHVLSYEGNDNEKTVPLLIFPSQDGMCDNYESFGMIDNIADYIESGRVHAFSVDAIDQESWSATWRDKHERGQTQEAYYHFVVDELVPWLYGLMGNGIPMTVTGCSMGANHAAIVALRRPDLFYGMMALSGVYDAAYFTDGYMDGNWYDNSPSRFLPNLPPDHPYIKMYNERQFILCIGQGAWETQGLETMHTIQRACEEKGIHIWLDFWGYDVFHDWPWWKTQTRYFLPIILEGYDQERYKDCQWSV